MGRRQEDGALPGARTLTHGVKVRCAATRARRALWWVRRESNPVPPVKSRVHRRLCFGPTEWSVRLDSNQGPSPYEGGALHLSYARAVMARAWRSTPELSLGFLESHQGAREKHGVTLSFKDRPAN